MNAFREALHQLPLGAKTKETGGKLLWLWWGGFCVFVFVFYVIGWFEGVFLMSIAWVLLIVLCFCEVLFVGLEGMSMVVAW